MELSRGKRAFVYLLRAYVAGQAPPPSFEWIVEFAPDGDVGPLWADATAGQVVSLLGFTRKLTPHERVRLAACAARAALAVVPDWPDLARALSAFERAPDKEILADLNRTIALTLTPGTVRNRFLQARLSVRSVGLAWTHTDGPHLALEHARQVIEVDRGIDRAATMHALADSMRALVPPLRLAELMEPA